MNQLETKMEEFIDKANETLDKLNKTANFLKWLYGGIIVIVLALYTDTRIDVVKKVDASDVEHTYVTKQDAILVHTLSTENTKNVANILTDDPELLKVIDMFNANYLSKVEKIYSK